ncbi:MAG: hypothetical protein LBB76_11665 [Azoarcus sp.]|jgi:hypothetical protein|nr:hypothetical protein [Azoarcus sp.]
MEWIVFSIQMLKEAVRAEEVEEYQLLFSHVAEKGKAVSDWMEESDGIRNLFFLAGAVPKQNDGSPSYAISLGNSSTTDPEIPAFSLCPIRMSWRIVGKPKNLG